MQIINEVTVVIKKRSFPSFIDELYKRDCDLVELRHVEERDDGYLYSLHIGFTSPKRFEEFITIIGNAGDKYKVLTVKSLMEDMIAGGLINVSGKTRLDTAADFRTTVLGAAEMIRGKIRSGHGYGFTGISRSVALVSGVKPSGETEQEHLLVEYAAAERDAVILNRFGGLNGFPVTIRFDHVEDIITVMKKIEHNFSVVRIMHVDEGSMMLNEQIVSELRTPVISLEHDEIPLFLLLFIIKILIKHRLKPEENTIGLVGIDLSAVRLARVLYTAGFHRVLGYDHSETAMLALENQGGLATTAENIFSNADITIIMKNNFKREEFQKIRPGQFVISLLPGEDLEGDAVSGKGVREFIQVDLSDLAVLFPGIARGLMETGPEPITDVKLVEYAKGLVSILSDSFEFPHIFSDIHDRVASLIRSGRVSG